MEHEKCYYCGGDANDETEYYTHTMYYIRKRMKLWVGYHYSTKQVRVPRCKACHSKHDNFGLIWTLPLLLGLFGLAFRITYGVDKNLWVALFGAGLFSMLVTGGIRWFAEIVFFEKTKGIPRADDIDRYPIVHEMLKAGWIKSRPDPGSLPATAEETRDSNKNK